jgi:hypothetical protein
MADRCGSVLVDDEETGEVELVPVAQAAGLEADS